MGRPRTHWFPEMDEVLIKGCNDGIGLTILAERIGVDIKSARYRRDELKLPRRTRGGRWKRFSPEQERRLREAWTDPKVSVKALAVELGFGPEVVAKRANLFGLGEKARHSPRDATLAAIRENPGIDTADLKRLGLSAPNSVHTILRQLERAGLVRRERRKGKFTATQGPIGRASRYWPLESLTLAA